MFAKNIIESWETGSSTINAIPGHLVGLKLFGVSLHAGKGSIIVYPDESAPDPWSALANSTEEIVETDNIRILATDDNFHFYEVSTSKELSCCMSYTWFSRLTYRLVRPLLVAYLANKFEKTCPKAVLAM